MIQPYPHDDQASQLIEIAAYFFDLDDASKLILICMQAYWPHDPAIMVVIRHIATGLCQHVGRSSATQLSHSQAQARPRKESLCNMQTQVSLSVDCIDMSLQFSHRPIGDTRKVKAWSYAGTTTRSTDILCIVLECQ